MNRRNKNEEINYRPFLALAVLLGAAFLFGGAKAETQKAENCVTVETTKKAFRGYAKFSTMSGDEIEPYRKAYNLVANRMMKTEGEEFFEAGPDFLLFAQIRGKMVIQPFIGGCAVVGHFAIPYNGHLMVLDEMTKPVGLKL